jgi:hypothetical protein
MAYRSSLPPTAPTLLGADKHYVFVATHLDGHLRPAVAVACALQRQLRAANGTGTVRFAALARARAFVESNGLAFVDLGAMPPDASAYADERMAAAVELALAPRERRPFWPFGNGVNGTGGGGKGSRHIKAFAAALLPWLPIVPGVLGAIASGRAMTDAFVAMEAAMLPALLGALLAGGAAGADVLVADFAALVRLRGC